MLHVRNRLIFPAGALALGVFFSLLAVVAFAGQNAGAQPSAAATAENAKRRIEDAAKGMPHSHSIGQVALSPNGRQLAWVERTEGGNEIRLAPFADPKKSVRVTAAAKSSEHCEEHDLVWAPNAQALGFFSDCAHREEQSDLYLQRIDGHGGLVGAPVQLSELHGYAEAPVYAPDGSSIAFLYVEGASRPAGALAAMKPWAGVIGEDGIEIQRVALTGTGLNSPQNSGPMPPHWATPAKLHVFEFDWSPDSKSLVYTAANPPGENNWWVAKLYTQQIGADPKAILSPSEVDGPLHGLQMAVPRWSPDGKQIAFIGGLMSDQGSTGGDVWVVPARGGAPVNLTPQRQASPAWIEWAGNQELFVNELAGGNAQLVLLRLDGQSDCAKNMLGAGANGPVFSLPASVGDGRMEMSLSSGAGHNLFVFKSSSFDRPEEIWAARTDNVLSSCAGNEQGNLTQLTHWNDGLKPGWGKAESLGWKSDDFNVQGWLMQPKNYDPAKKYPLIVIVHGGPAAAETPSWGGRGLGAAFFSALGYFVLEPNPRGSFGQGEAFTQANRKDFGYGDLRDILAGVDAALVKYPIDPNRVGLTGWSYGGFMSMFAVTQTGRFKAAVAGAGISDWQSYYGENSIGEWMLPYFGATVYDDPAVYAKSSAINQIKKVTTPTLVVVGDRDGECPAPQSFEFWHALKALGVPTQLVVYPNEGHGFSDADHRRDVMQRTLGWFDRYLEADPGQKP